MNALRQFREVVSILFTQGPELLADRIDRWLREVHRAVDVGTDDSPVAHCAICRASWPCDEWIAADDRIISRAAER